MIFNIHPESKIGYKKITPAEMGSGRQTHIGLHQKSLTYLSHFHRTSLSQFLYQNQCKDLLCLLNFITRENGDIEAPKIRKGEDHELFANGEPINSVVKEIREIATRVGRTDNWYLLWFGLENEDLVFFLFQEGSEDYDAIKQILGNINDVRDTIENLDVAFNAILKYLLQKLTITNIDYLEELETYAQTGEASEITKRIFPKKRDIEKANKKARETGLTGEQLIQTYLTELRAKKEIIDFEWMNKSREVGLPYDFEIIQLDKKTYYSDVKTTSYRFKQEMFFSSGELAFINQNKNYLIHRVYDVDNKPKLRKCDNIQEVSNLYIPHYNTFNQELTKLSFKIKSLSIGVPPNLKLLNFDKEIIL